MPIPTLAEWLEEWSDSRRHHLEASSVVSYRVMADAYLLPHLGDVPLDRLDVRTIEATYATLLTRGGRGGKPLAPRTVAYAHAVLHRALVDAVRLGVLATNPAASATIPRRAADGRAPRRLRVWDAEQVRHFLAVCADHPLADLWAVALGTGLRSVRHASDASRYEVGVDDELAGFTTYRPQGDHLAFTHTETLPASEGRGLASRLVADALDDVRADGRQILPFCPFVRRFVAEDAGYLDLVPASQRARFELTLAAEPQPGPDHG